MKLSQFKFKLPEELVAAEPNHLTFDNPDGTVDKVYRRDESRLMVLHRRSGAIDMYKKDGRGRQVKGPDGKPQWITFRDIAGYFTEGDVFILNDTKVFPARLFGTKEKTDAEIEVFLLRELNTEYRLWDVLVEPARKIRIGNKLFFQEDGPMVAEVIDNTTSRGRTLRFLYDCPHDEFKEELYKLGYAPLPTYIINKRRQADPSKEKASERELIYPADNDIYQTIYAKSEGAVTAPATGLHFSRELLKILEIRGVDTAYITVHCGLGSFEHIEVEDLSKHKISSEQMLIGADACRKVNHAKQTGHRVCAVGASVGRATETAAGTDGLLKEYDGWTNKFIFPPYEFGMADTMVVNFYHPETPMVMETCAFGGYDLVMKAYHTAIENGYHFGCFGDSLLILND